ncbi:MAG: molecular chaperone HtpG [Rhabdochlamydiaceae bacterium]|nr:molecular chaperone HtpG [Candidatus Amphrikana amoebophyrae]
MAKGKLKIHSENILPILKKSLYSDKDIYLRELVSNSCDAMSKLKTLRDQNEYSFKDEELRIDITLDVEKKTITIADTGLGMTQDEVKNYIAQLAFSGAEEFLQKYEQGKEEDQIIGHFGLGFYSSFMVSKHVDLETLSYQDKAESVFWSSDGSYDYTIKKGKRTERGTTITLYIDDDSSEFLEEAKLREILTKYCAFLPYPIYLGEDHINKKEPLWMKPANQCTDEEYLDFYKALYPMDPDPIFWVHLNVDYPFNLKGILYFPKITKHFDFSQSHIKLFCNRVFVSENCKDLIPEHMMVLRGAIDSPDIPLNVSRSYLQMDKTVRQLGAHISKKVADRLAGWYSSEKEKFCAAWQDMQLIIKLGVLHDEKFYERVKEFLIWQTTEGEWMTTEEYLEKNKEKTDGKVIYVTDKDHASHFINMYKDKGVDVIVANATLDSHLINQLETKVEGAKFQRVDGAVDDMMLDKKREKSVVDADGKAESDKIGETIKKLLDIENIDVEAKSLDSDSVPGFVMMDEHARRMRDYMRLSQGEGAAPMMGNFEKHTYVVNTNSKLIQSIIELEVDNPDLAKAMTKQVYELSLLSQRELKPEALTTFINRSNDVLEKLALFQKVKGKTPTSA